MSSNLTNVEKKDAVEKKNFWKVFWREVRNWGIVIILCSVIISHIIISGSINTSINTLKNHIGTGQYSMILNFDERLKQTEIINKGIGWEKGMTVGDFYDKVWTEKIIKLLSFDEKTFTFTNSEKENIATAVKRVLPMYQTRWEAINQISLVPNLFVICPSSDVIEKERMNALMQSLDQRWPYNMVNDKNGTGVTIIVEYFEHGYPNYLIIIDTSVGLG